MTAVMSQAEVKARADAEQQRATRPQVSAWVSASAGSGKTKVLIDRVLALLLAGAEPGKLLCLTFTKAAAAEMANRLAARLAGWATAGDLKLDEALTPLLGGVAPGEETRRLARTLFARVLDVPGGMKIQTIHAFCQSLLGRFPLEAGVAPHFQVLDERSAAEFLATSRVEALVRDAALSEALAGIAAYTSEGGFAEILAALLKERGRLGAVLGDTQALAETLAALRKALDLRPDDDWDELLEAGCRDEAFDHMGLRLALEGLRQGGKTDQERAEVLAAWLEAPHGRIESFTEYLAVYFKERGEGDVRARLITKPALAAAPGADAVLTAEAVRLERLRAKLRAITVFEATAALLSIGGAVLGGYEGHKQARALLDYDDLILRTRDLLTAGPGRTDWVLFKLDGGLDHLLIDEAQDTNPEQWQVIESLTGEFFVGESRAGEARSVFAVGDPKQSIYGFQRADPAGFAAMQEHYAARARGAGQALEAVPLDVSFRSTEAVLTLVDRVFSDPEARDGLFLDDDTALVHRPVRSGQAGLVELWPPVDPVEPEPADPWASAEPAAPGGGGLAPPEARLAALIARRIWSWTRDPARAEDSEVRLPSRGRRISPGDVMVLVRRRNAFVECLVRDLKRLGVPVAGVDRMVLTEQLAVMDLIALGRVLLLPEDDLTLATVLKGPLVGLGEEDLFDLAHDREGRLWAALARRRSERPSFAAAHDILTSLQARADYVRPFELYAEILGAGQGRAALVGRLGEDANDPLDEFLSLALAYEREHVPSLEGFLHWLEAGAQEVKRDLEQGSDAVRVMTVHGAKGLQAPVVILPDTLQVPQGERGLLWLKDERASDSQPLPVWPLRQAYDAEATAQARLDERNRREAEYRRLLYVAMTRAEDRLYVCGWNTRRKASTQSWYHLVEKAMESLGDTGQAEPVDFDSTPELEDGWIGPAWRLETAQREAASATVEAGVPGETETPLPAWALSPPATEPAPPRPLAPTRPTGDPPPAASPLATAAEQRFRHGLLVHRLLEHLPDLPPDARAAAGARYLAQPRHDLDEEARTAVLEQALGVMALPESEALFGPESLAEVPVSGVVAGRDGPLVISGQVDRLVVGESLVQIVDYKTNREPPAHAADAGLAYLRQMASYRAVLEGLFPGREIRCLLLWTVGPRLMQISDDLLASHAP